jgi:hypothetical protein
MYLLYYKTFLQAESVFTFLALSNTANGVESIYKVGAPLTHTVTHMNGGQQEDLQINMGYEPLNSRNALCLAQLKI